MMPASRSIADRVFSTAMRRSQQALKGLPLLKSMAAGDIILPEKVVNRVLDKAGLDEELPMHWETLKVRFRDGYFELDVQGAVKFIHGPTFRIQARFESVEISLNKQVIRIRLLREIQTFAHGIVERALMLFVRAIFGKLLEAESLLKVMDRGHVAFTQEEPDLLRIELHEFKPLKKHLSGHVMGAAAAVLGRDTLLVKSIDCEHGRMIIRTTTVAREMSSKAIKLGAVAGNAAGKIGNVAGRAANRMANVLQEAGRQVAEDVKHGLQALEDMEESSEEEDL